MTNMTINTSCLCLKVQCTFSLPVTNVVQCHCQNCRQMQGSDYSTWVAVPEKQFSIIDGAELLSLFRFNERSSKYFCSECGTAVHGINGKHFVDHILVPLGTVDNYSSPLQPQIQVYTDDKAPWVQLMDHVPVMSGK